MTFPIALSIVIGVVLLALIIGFARRRRRRRRPLRQRDVDLNIQHFDGRRGDRR